MSEETIIHDEIQESIEEVAEDALPDKPSQDGKSMLIVVGFVVGLFVLFYAGSVGYNYFFGAPDVQTLDDLHKDNLDGNLQDDLEGYVYRGFSFVKTDGLWWTSINREGTLVKIPLHYGPKEVEHVKVSGKIDADLFNSKEQFYISVDPETVNKYYTLALAEFSVNVVKGVLRQPIGVCNKEHESCDNRTIANCEDTKGNPLIEFVHAKEEPSIVYSDKCVKVTGHNEEIVKAADRVLYQWYGIMN